MSPQHIFTQTAADWPTPHGRDIHREESESTYSPSSLRETFGKETSLVPIRSLLTLGVIALGIWAALAILPDLNRYFGARPT